MLRGQSIKTVVLIFIISLLPTGSQAKEMITWMEAVAPPFYIHDGELKGQGYQDLITALLEQQLPEYEHRHMKANISRHYQQWKEGKRACGLAMFKTPEREEFAYFSIPSVFTLPTVLIVRKDHLPTLGGKETINLTELLKTNRFIIGRSNNRSYGLEFDSTLNAYGNETNIFAYEGPELSHNLFKMLLAGRIDALAGLPEEAMYLAETMGVRDKITTIGIEENQVNHDASLTYVACSKTDWGKSTIEDINEALLKIRPTEEYRAAYERWLAPAAIGGYRQLYQEIFLNITK
ncbi:MAG: TIGR02285 family protein [Desulforhopalus sp.]